jgi:hypothetical protein
VTHQRPAMPPIWPRSISADLSVCGVCLRTGRWHSPFHEIPSRRSIKKMRF